MVTSEVPKDEAARQAVVEVAGVPGGVTVGPGRRFGGDDPEEASS